ncbi:uncharacterized protein [Aristolochia californica]|uniref:uncharacterized protein n=1 Tax=Aristolochia californica TaxID=171875 RepID=UPI0035D8E11B
MASPDISSRVSTQTIDRAVTALLKWIKAQAKHQKAQLLEHDEFIYLVLSLKKIPANSRTNPSKIPLPHPLHPLDGSKEICLIINDSRRGPNPLTSEDAKKKIQAESIPVSKVIKLSKLKTDYRPFEAKRKLCGSYDIFFADRTVLSHLPRLVGKHFFKKKKIPIPIDLSHKNWKAQIEQACSSALLYLRTGSCCILKVGRVFQGRDQLMENIAAAIEGAAKIVPKGWANIRSLHLKSLESVALPLYQIVPEVGLKIEVSKREEKGEEKNEMNVMEIKNDEANAPKEEEKKKKKKTSVKKGRIHEVRYMDGDIVKLMEDLVGDDDSGVKEVNELNVADVVTRKEKKTKRMAGEMAGTEKKKIRKESNDSVGTEKKKIKKKDEFPIEFEVEQQKSLKKTKSKGKLEQESLSTEKSGQGDALGSLNGVMKKISAVKSGEEKTKSIKNKKKKM